MSAVLAVFNRSGGEVAQHVVEAMLSVRPERGPDGADHWRAGHVTLAHQHFWLLPEEVGERQPLVQDGLALAADARLDNRDEIGRLLRIDRTDLAGLSDAQLLLAAYEYWGEECPAYLMGDFAFVIWDSGENRLFAARDALGTRELSYYMDDRICIISSDLSAILAHPCVEPRMNESRVATYLANIWDQHEETFYQDIYYLKPAHSLSVTAIRDSLQCYWEIDPARTLRYRDPQEYSDQFRELMTDAVRCRVRTTGPVGVSLSGGLDSTSVAALAAPMLASRGVHERRLRSFSYVFDELTACDERQYIRPLVERYDLEAEYLPSDDNWPLKDLSQWPLSRDYVLADPFALLPRSIMAAAGRAGTRVLLTGFNGDVLSTGQHYWALDMWRHARLGHLGKTILNDRRSIKWRDSFVEYGVRRLIPPRVARAYRRLRPRLMTSVSPGIDPRFIARTDINRRLSPDIPIKEDWPPGAWQRYQSLTMAAFSHGPGAVRYQYNSHVVEQISPFYDRRLIEFVMAVPAYILGVPGEDRRMHRRAMEGILPEEIRWRRYRTSFNPLYLKGLQGEAWPTVRRIMIDPQVVHRGIIRGDWLKEQLQRGYDSSPEADFLWFSLCLELWLQRYWS